MAEMNSSGTGQYGHHVPAADIEAFRETVERWRNEAVESAVRIKVLENTLSTILELNPANPAAIKVAREMAKQAMGWVCR